MRRLRRRHNQKRQREITEQMHESGADQMALLREKEALRRQMIQDVSSSRAPLGTRG